MDLVDLRCPYCGNSLEIEDHYYPYDNTAYQKIHCDYGCGAQWGRYGDAEKGPDLNKLAEIKRKKEAR